ncbi:MAG: 3-oxoacyl-[acyl-carrier-protein] reductase [Gemmatimonadetes bacterium]|nr:3-oxoacyl-[acyl-carrier-protein] reductase [Gemmatimonadota bacterium]NNM06794.1 3-oxoacyl-[acyl-carrier-protein] reductase [Gemmatimonadota bacterium]
MELEGQVALVTGGARGIGLAVAEALAEAGAKVAVVDVDAKDSQNAAAGLPGAGHQGYLGNVTDGEGLQAVLKQIEEDVGPVEILVNNAGITRDNLILRMTEEEWDQVLTVNLKGAFNATKAVARGMMKRRSGAIVNIASVIGLMGNAGQANYAASKAGLIGFTKSIAREFASRGVRCNAIAPGFIQTAMTDKLSPEIVDGLKAQIPMGSLGTPEDVAKVVRFLAGPGAAYITGQVIAVDGGMVM